MKYLDGFWIKVRRFFGMEKDDFYLTIIEKGARAGVYNGVDISAELYGYFATTDNLPNQEYNNISQNVDKYFKPLLKDGYFTIKNNCKEANPVSNRNWKEAIDVKLAITPKGLIFINENRKLNAGYRANSLTRWFIFATIAIGRILH